MSPSYPLRLAAGSALAAFGICTLLSHLLLSGWEHSAVAGQDAVTRGVLLLALFLPAFAITSVCATAAFAVLITGRTGPPLLQKIGVAVVGAVLGVLVILFLGDPVVLALPRVMPAWLFHGIGLVVAGLVLAGGVVTIIGLRRPAAVPAALGAPHE